MRYLRPALCGLALLSLTACALSESDLRATLGQWLVLGETRQFTTNMTCSAAVFSLRSERISDDLPVARSAPEAATLARLRAPFVLQFGTLSVSAMSEVLREFDYPLGARVLNAGLGARSCLPEASIDAYLAAILRGGEAAIFDPQTNSLTVVDSGLGRAWFTKGASW